MLKGQEAISNYKSQLSNRFYSNSMAIQVLVCLILIFILVIEVVKFFKKIYEWQADQQMRIQQRFAQESRSMMRQRSFPEGPAAAAERRQEQLPKSRGQRIKKQAYIPPVVMIEEVIKNKLPQIAIIAINVVTLASYEYCAIVSYISIVIIVIAQLIGSEHVKLKFGLDAISKVLLLSLYINAFTVAKPTQT